jgi:hypothetical protein
MKFKPLTTLNRPRIKKIVRFGYGEAGASNPTRDDVILIKLVQRDRSTQNQVCRRVHFFSTHHATTKDKPHSSAIFTCACKTQARGIINLLIDSPNFRVACCSVAQTLCWHRSLGAKSVATHDMDVIVTRGRRHRSGVQTIQHNPFIICG